MNKMVLHGSEEGRLLSKARSKCSLDEGGLDKVRNGLSSIFYSFVLRLPLNRRGQDS